MRELQRKQHMVCRHILTDNPTRASVHFNAYVEAATR